MVDQSLIEAEITELRAAQKNYSREEIKENFDGILLDIANDVHALYDVYEEEYGKSVIETFFQYLIDTKEITSLDNAGKAISQYFKTFDRFFLSLAQSRKSRAGKTFEHIHNSLFKMLKYPFDEHIVINGKPDFLMPSANHYNKNPMECIIFTAKHSIRERWRQIVTEGTRGLGFYLATRDTKVSKIQLKEMLLRFVLNNNGSSNRKYFNLLKGYLELNREKLNLDINIDSITMKFRISETSQSLSSAETLGLFETLLKIIHKSYEISNTNNLDIEGMINNWIRIFKKWKNESIGNSFYSKKYLQNERQELFNSLLKNDNFENIKDELKHLIQENEIINF